MRNMTPLVLSYLRRHRLDTYVWGWEGSSPRETLSPWISLKHFSQKWYLSARSPYFGELHVRHQHSQSQRGHEEAATNHGRAGQGTAGRGRAGRGAHTQEEAEGKVGRRQEEAANRDAGFLCWVGGF